MSPEDVGGEEMLSSIQRDIEEIVSDSLKINMICYCQQLLSEDSKSIPSGALCCLCKKAMGYKSYDCNNESCIYKRLSGLGFWICSSCFEQGAYITLNHTEDEWKEIFVSKLRSSISAMS